ncbi:MAG: peptide chain release factor N(5)-glutamine methyltransferase, partial [Candidatus Omnitrophica bacterium]|nr:peptide chain release factor N(5)-glutamine methyltransferase [Candidatus Omnitrophota bacterium]
TQYAIRILDIGTGCGNIAISLTKYLPQSKIIALDISHSALLKARENAEILDVSDKVAFLESDLLGALKEKGLFDIIICNPPYVSEKDMRRLPDEVREEPHSALYGGVDGLNFYRRIVKDAKSYLKKEGFLLVETGYNQSESVKALLEDNGYINIEIFRDYSGIDRIVKAKVR